MAIFCVYLEPRLKIAEVREIGDIINDQILQLKAKGDSLIFIGGDFNRKSFNLDGFPDIMQANFDPTRLDACLDIMYTNATQPASNVWPPLQTMQGVPSDHSCVVFSGSEAITKDFVWIKRRVRKHTKKAVREFGRRMEQTNWPGVLPSTEPPDALVAKFHSIMQKWIDELFPFKSCRRRSNEDPWITENIRRMAKQKRRVFRREGKSNLWRALRDRVTEKVNASRG